MYVKLACINSFLLKQEKGQGNNIYSGFTLPLIKPLHITSWLKDTPGMEEQVQHHFEEALSQNQRLRHPAKQLSQCSP